MSRELVRDRLPGFFKTGARPGHIHILDKRFAGGGNFQVLEKEGKRRTETENRGFTCGMLVLAVFFSGIKGRRQGFREFFSRQSGVRGMKLGAYQFPVSGEIGKNLEKITGATVRAASEGVQLLAFRSAL